jgi:predicted N-acetyltransferase YhbS
VFGGQMDIQSVELKDFDSIKRLIKDVSERDIFPKLSARGKMAYRTHILPDVYSAFDDRQFYSLKVVSDGEIVGFGSLREGRYLTYLFVSKTIQGKGLGRRLINVLLESTTAKEISLRSSVNAIGFYKSCGFEVTGEEAEFHGIRFVPMRLVRK